MRQASSMWFLVGGLAVAGLILASLAIQPMALQAREEPAADETAAAAGVEPADPPDRGSAGSDAVELPAMAPPTRRRAETALMSALMTLRAQTQLYRLEHLGRLPGVPREGRFSAALYVEQMTRPTDMEGRVDPPDGVRLGPYIAEVPPNPFVDRSVARTVTGGEEAVAGDGASGWYVNTAEGTVHANDAEHAGW